MGSRLNCNYKESEMNCFKGDASFFLFSHFSCCKMNCENALKIYYCNTWALCITLKIHFKSFTIGFIVLCNILGFEEVQKQLVKLQMNEVT